MNTTHIENEITQAELQEMAELIKKLTSKEKERVLYMLQGAAMISEAMNAHAVAAI